MSFVRNVKLFIALDEKAFFALGKRNTRFRVFLGISRNEKTVSKERRDPGEDEILLPTPAKGKGGLVVGIRMTLPCFLGWLLVRVAKRQMYL
jgi:hypothetical protein